MLALPPRPQPTKVCTTVSCRGPRNFWAHRRCRRGHRRPRVCLGQGVGRCRSASGDLRSWAWAPRCGSRSSGCHSNWCRVW